MSVPCGNRTRNYSLGGYCYIHLTKETYYTKHPYNINIIILSYIIKSVNNHINHFLPYDSINHFYAITTFVPSLFQSEKSASTPVQLFLNITKYAKKLHLSNLHKQKQIAITLSGYHYLFIH